MRVFCCLIAFVFCFGPFAQASSLEDVWGEVHPLLSDAVSELICAPMCRTLPGILWKQIRIV